MKHIKSECLSQMIFFCERSLRRAVKEYIAHHDAERNHQGLDYKIIDPMHHMEVARTAFPVARRLECQVMFSQPEKR